MPRQNLTLLDFSGGETPTPQERHDMARRAGYAEGREHGYAEGFADATKAAVEDQTALSQQALERLEDLRFTQAEAVALLVRKLDPFLRAISDQILPGIATEAVFATLANELVDRLARDAAQLEIQAGSSIAPLLADLGAPGISVIASEQLAPDEVLIGSTQEMVSYDAGPVVSQIKAAIGGFLESSARSSANE